MTRYSLLILTLIFLSCNPTTTTSESTIHFSHSKTQQITEILLTETKLGNLELDKLIETNMLTTIKSTFPDFQVTKKVGQQDGPDFNLYQVTQSGQEIFFISMDSYDTIIVQDLSTNNKAIIDKYGISVGKKVEYALEKRPNLIFHLDLHQNIYATAKNSKIEYRLTGTFKPLNDTKYFADDYSVKKWQTAGMEIEYLIWRNKKVW